MLLFFFHSWITWVVLVLIGAVVVTVTTRLQGLQERRRAKAYEQRIVETKERLCREAGS
jgi:heme exporter protein D